MGKVGNNHISAFLKKWDHVLQSKKEQMFDLANGQGIPISNTCMIAFWLHYLPVDWQISLNKMDKKGNIVKSQ